VSDCDCDHGWRYASPRYVEGLFPITLSMSDEQRAAAQRRRDTYAGTEFVFPCETCRPEQFERWANGCLAPEHRASRCALCREQLGESAARRADARAHTSAAL
jgi:hypothetical protein